MLHLLTTIYTTKQKINKKTLVEITLDKAINSNVFTKIVVFHDKNLLRVCAVNKKIANQTYKNIKNIPLYNSTETIPLLKDILSLINGKVPLLIEIKNYTL